MLTCPAAELVDGSKVLYFEQVSEHFYGSVEVTYLCVFVFGRFIFALNIISSMMLFFVLLGFLEESTKTLSAGRVLYLVCEKFYLCFLFLLLCA